MHLNQNLLVLMYLFLRFVIFPKEGRFSARLCFRTCVVCFVTSDSGCVAV